MKIWEAVLIAGIAVPVGIWGLSTSYTSTYQSEVLNMTSSERVCSGSDDCKYLVYTDQGTFENTDSLWYRKFNSSDLHGRIKGGGTYQAETVGWRIPLLSSYRNIISAQQISE